MTKFTKLSVYSVAATVLIGCAVIFLGRSVIAKGLNSLQIVPRPEHVTELYFTDYHKPPASLKPGTLQKVTFTIHNLEHASTQYHYQISTKSSSGAEHLWSEGNIPLADNQSQVTTRTITMPAAAGRTAVEVDLDYISTAFGSSAPSLQKQSIRYWVDVQALRNAL